ncbi:D-tyrosyl-tRNA(Tyr) deacylase [Coccidioides posadasii str. Silveira]|uniref:D-aminoacyl-tRNA deacylase n=3 Tax=Coccidioides TaxID=5500 RepID=E9D7I9_COCPS|nr:D-tyrosyl-tRNA deacylase family protein [Coccidioides posadasii C735 delta SOWgp]EER25604.1 D-tyrosyl-tRNA deacylase family protein [Coccidioides posadasii C735 delta SOWgp]EFW17348.1 D-tyrosyl-tRNA(Tyr) deacylase [Coccidioides posadasii str. Silveira]KMP05717.1 D-tyrosyl-tRNA(Tyr) deacylase [Coccidioides immitis RMSCC 2394]QVM05370.1 D-tyrosyl-tRNA(Tyr) deacylase [Coccidioides posadasii str. Silveira]|eukprot:XP_003067749.1 D-tyrosyl-tRNA deacylase family protein [Coccidioides posadasii C735 delta SOWgp]
MKAILQRVSSASVTVDTKLVSYIGRGVLVLAAVGPHDTEKDAEALAAKVLKLKMWPDDSGANWKKNVQDIQGEVLCVSQFTLFAKVKKGNKPDFHGAADAVKAKELYEYFYSKVGALYNPDRVKNGVFQAMMEVGLVNDGPVTLELNTDSKKAE